MIFPAALPVVINAGTTMTQQRHSMLRMMRGGIRMASKPETLKDQVKRLIKSDRAARARQERDAKFRKELEAMPRALRAAAIRHHVKENFIG